MILKCCVSDINYLHLLSTRTNQFKSFSTVSEKVCFQNEFFCIPFASRYGNTLFRIFKRNSDVVIPAECHKIQQQNKLLPKNNIINSVHGMRFIDMICAYTSKHIQLLPYALKSILYSINIYN